MATLFERIASGEIPAHKVAETASHLAFLDINPQVEGHTLCIPKKATDYIFDLPDDELAALMRFAKSVAKQLEATVDCARIGVAVVGLEVPHVHVHLMPIETVGDLSFGKSNLQPSSEALAELAARIRAVE